MNSYKNISWWENARRIRLLEEFRNDVVSYFNNSSYEWMAEGRIEKPEAEKARQRINHTIVQAQHIIEAAGVAPSVTWTPPPMVGGYVQRVELILNLFELNKFKIPADRAVDAIEMALGVYQSDRTTVFCRTINPLWWLFRGLLWFVRIPFVLLGAVGFDAAHAEGSTSGKFFKATFALVTATAALLTILNLLGLK